MRYQLFISNEIGTTCRKFTTQDQGELLVHITEWAEDNDVIQVVQYDLLAPEQDGPQPVVKVGSFAAYYAADHGQTMDMLYIFDAKGRGYDLHTTLNQMVKDQVLKDKEAQMEQIHKLLGGDKDALRASIQRVAQQKGRTEQEQMERLLKNLRTA